jgi:hypothetical protein
LQLLMVFQLFLRSLQVIDLLVLHLHVPLRLLKLDLQATNALHRLLVGLRSDLWDVAEVEHVFELFGLCKRTGNTGRSYFLIHNKYVY